MSSLSSSATMLDSSNPQLWLSNPESEGMDDYNILIVIEERREKIEERESGCVRVWACIRGEGEMR